MSQLHRQSSLTEDQQQMICDYVDGLLEADEAEKAKAFIDIQPDAMKAALHYTSHIESMASELSRQEIVYQPPQSVRRSQNSLFTDMSSFFRQFFSVRSPMVYTMAATAVVFIAVLFLAQSPILQRNQVTIASFQDDPTIQFTAKNKLPGVGFFTQSGNTSKPFEDIRIELISENTLKISWPEVDGAELYKMRIQVFNQGKKTVLKENSTQVNYTTFLVEPEHQAGKANKRYEWVLYGNTADDRMFYASGGFVISRYKAENDRDYDSW